MKKYLLAVVLIFNFCFILTAEEKKNDSLLFIDLSSGIEYPLDQLDFENDLLSMGGSGTVTGGMALPFAPFLSVNGSLSYSYIPVPAETSLSTIAGGIGGGIKKEFNPRFLAYGNIVGGGFFSFFNNTVQDDDGEQYAAQSGGNPYVSLSGGVSFYVSPSFSLSMEVSYFNNIGFYQGVRGALGTSIHLDGFSRKVNLHSIGMDSLFPVLSRYYSTNAMGTAVLENKERFPVQDVEVSLFIKDYMDNPKVCFRTDEIQSGAAREVQFYTLFSEDVLDMEDGNKVIAEINTAYTLNGSRQTTTSYETIQLYGRNAITWDDDRKAALFVNATDPEILKFTKPVAGYIRDSGASPISQNLRMAMGLFGALSNYGIGYVIDPNTPSYEESSLNTRVIDFLQFPEQTMYYKGGDCDDLSILYCSLLESIGIETAFITIPGHIFMAFSINMTPEECERTFTNTDNFIYMDEKTWVPVEITLIREDFLQAWNTGAEEWRDNFPGGSAGFYPVHEAWKVYEQPGTPSGNMKFVLPELAGIGEIYKAVLNTFIDREMYPKVAALENKIEGSNNPLPKLNSLGVLYARYGQNEKAKEIFQDILRRGGYFKTHINLGNLFFLENNMERALEMYKNAEEEKPNHASVLLNMARVHYELGNLALVNQYYARLERISPGRAERFAWLNLQRNTDSRADDADGISGVMVWEED